MLRAKQTARSKMKKKTFSRAGSEAQYGPRLAGAVLHDYLENSDDALAVAFRNQSTADEENEDDRLFRDFFPDTHLCVDLKLITRKHGRMHVGEYINCLLTRDGEYHFKAVETASEMKKKAVRNPHLFRGKCINVVRKDNALYLTFNRPVYSETFTFADFCREAAEELQVVAGLVEEGE